MATKVMLAPAIAQRAQKELAAPSRATPAEEKPKRRRTSVYDADGNEVFITLMCLKCHQMRPLSQFGLRRMTDGAIRNQPWCKSCRKSGAGEATRPQRRGRRREEASAGSGESPIACGSPREPKIVDVGTLAAQVVAALNGGRR